MAASRSALQPSFWHGYRQLLRRILATFVRASAFITGNVFLALREPDVVTSGSTLDGSRLILSSLDGNAVFGVDANNGTLLWRVPDPRHSDAQEGCCPGCVGSAEARSAGVLETRERDGRLSQVEAEANGGFSLYEGQARRPNGAPQLILVDVGTNEQLPLHDALGSLDKVVAVLWPSSPVTVAWISPRTGASVSSATTFPLLRTGFVKLTPYADASTGHLRGVVLVDTETSTAVCLTPSQSCNSEVEQGLPAYRLRGDFGLVGSRVFSNGSGFGSHAGNATESWNVHFDASGERIVSMTDAIEEPFTVQTMMSTDGTLLSKLPTANHILTITAHKETGRLQLYLIDAYRGRIILSRKLPEEATTPVRVLLKGHRALAVYRNANRWRYDVLSMELYKRAPSVLSGNTDPLRSLVALARGGEKLDVESLSALNPLVLSRSYILSAGFPRALSFTQTKLGVTPQSLIMANNQGQVISLGHQIMSARRPYPPTLTASRSQASQEPTDDTLPPYTSIIPVNPADILSRDTAVLWVRGILCEAERLESSSIVFAYGIDMLYKVVQPASAFDAVGNDFNQPLVMTILGGTVILVWFARRKAIQAEQQLSWA